MKIKSIIFLAVMVLFIGALKSQSNSPWTPVLVSMDGTNTYKGVEMYYSLSKCGNKDVVLVKLINTNSNAVKAQWITAVVSNDNKEHYGKTQLVSVNLKANSESVGACNSKPSELVIKLADFGVTSEQFQTIVGSSFYVQ